MTNFKNRITPQPDPGDHARSENCRRTRRQDSSNRYLFRELPLATDTVEEEQEHFSRPDTKRMWGLNGSTRAAGSRTRANK